MLMFVLLSRRLDDTEKLGKGMKEIGFSEERVPWYLLFSGTLRSNSKN